MLQSAHLIEQTSNRPDVRLGVVAFVFEDLGAHVVGSAREGRGHVHRSLQYPRDAKVADLDYFVLQEYVSFKSRKAED